MTGAEVAGLALAGASLGYGVYAGEQSAAAGRESLGQQNAAQDEAKRRSNSARRDAQQADQKANQRKPNVLALLANNTGPSRPNTLLAPLFGGTNPLGS